MSHVLTKSAKGLREASGRTQDLPDELREILKLCRGQFVAEDLVAGVAAAEREEVAKALLWLTQTGFLREVMEVDTPEPEALRIEISPGSPLDHRVSPMVEPAGGIEQQHSDDVANQLRSEFAARRGQRDDDTNEQVRQAEEAARKKAEEKAQKEAAEKAQLEAEERIRREAEARVKREAEEKLRMEVLERERIEAEENARKEAAERTRRAAEERAKREEAEKAKRVADEKAKREADERELEEMRERIRQRQLGRRRVLTPIIVLLLILPGFGLWGIGYLPFEGKRLEFQQRAAQMLGVPVKISSARFVPLPHPQWQLDGVTMGQGSAAVSVQRVDIDVSVTALWALPDELDHVHLVSPAIPVAGLPLMLASPAGMPELKLRNLSGSGAVLVGKLQVSPPLSLTTSIDQGRLASISGEGRNDELGKFDLTGISVGGGWQLAVTSGVCKLPFGLDLELTDCALKAKLQTDALVVDKFAARMHNGDVSYAGTLSWGKDWMTNGRVELSRVDGSQWLPAWLKDGFIDGSGELVGEAAAPEQLLSGSRLAGRFKVAPGTLIAIDLDRVVQGRSTGEQFRFDLLEGNVLIENKRADLVGLHLTAGALAADGILAIETDKSVRGRMSVEVKTPSARLSSNVAITGTLDKPQYQH